MSGHAGNERGRARLERLDHAGHDRDAGRADLLALVAGNAAEDIGLRQRTGDLGGIVARIERCLA